MKIITGMHRSGTSAVARLCYEAGADMGDPRTFYRPDRWNPDGYYEQPDIHAINMPLINGPWWKFAYFCLPSTATIMRRARQRGVQIRQTAEQYRNRVVKETRFCLTLPAWLEYGAQVEKLLVCLREPIRVAHSIQKRNHIPIRLGLELWYIHNSRLLEHAGDIPLWFVLYDRVLDERSYVAEMGCAFEFLGYQMGAKQLCQVYARAVRPTMNHNRQEEVVYPEKIRVLWKQLRERREGQFQDVVP